MKDIRQVSKGTRRAVQLAATLLTTLLLIVVLAAVTAMRPAASQFSPATPPGPGNQAVTTTIFPFGYYGLEWPEVQNTGFSPRVYIDSGMKPADITPVLDLAQSAGVQVFQYLPPGALSLPLPLLRDQWVAPATAYPASVLAGFYPAEEPSINEIPAMVDLLNLVHETDPLARPVVTYLGFFNVSNIQSFQDTVDVDLLGAYPTFKGFPQALMTGVTHSGRQALWPAGKRFFAVPETFGPILAHPQGPLLLRNNVFQAAIGGAEGFIFFESSGFDPSRYPAFRAELDRLHDQFVGSGNLGSVLLSPDPPQVVSHTILSGPTDPIILDQFEFLRAYERIQYHLEVYQGQAYLLAANIGDAALSVEFRHLPSQAATLHVLFEDRTLPLTNAAFRDTFEPFQVHVYRMPARLPEPVQFLPVISKPAGP